jgi:hypothetical protein
MGHPAVKVIVPLVLLGIAAASWALRPASRTLAAATGGEDRCSRDRAGGVTPWSIRI